MSDKNYSNATVVFKEAKPYVVIENLQKILSYNTVVEQYDEQSADKLVVLPEKHYIFTGSNGSLSVAGSEIHSVFFN